MLKTNPLDRGNIVKWFQLPFLLKLKHFRVIEWAEGFTLNPQIISHDFPFL